MELVVLRLKGADFVSDVRCDKMNPKALMLLGLGRCAGLTAMSIFKKMNIKPRIVRNRVPRRDFYSHARRRECFYSREYRV